MSNTCTTKHTTYQYTTHGAHGLTQHMRLTVSTQVEHNTENCYPIQMPHKLNTTCATQCGVPMGCLCLIETQCSLVKITRETKKHPSKIDNRIAKTTGFCCTHITAMSPLWCGALLFTNDSCFSRIMQIYNLEIHEKIRVGIQLYTASEPRSRRRVREG